jgi:tetratricopeptide (TPR) repeat protein
VSLGEWIADTLREQPDKLSRCTNIDLSEFSAPADGALTSLLSQLLVAAENIGWSSVGRQYWEQIVLPTELKSLVGASKANIETVLSAFVKARNNGVEGHGLPGEYDAEADIAFIRAVVSGVAPFLPIAEKDGVTLTLPKLGDKPPRSLRTLRLFDGDPICYRKIKRVSAGRVQVDAQIQRTPLTREDVSFESENVLFELPRRSSLEYQVIDTSWSENWNPFAHVPDRLASSDVFTGRGTELDALADWADDPDSRKCMVYGDGGIGKTTLVVEFLHRLLEGHSGVKWRPELITFYTAKKTRWGLQGLEHISAQDVGVADVAVEVARMLSTPALDRSWFDRGSLEVVQKLAGLQQELKISRDSHLIILDNTETMAKSDSDIQALARQINELSRRVGRVILTSRRREAIEALPIQTESWSEEEGGEFLRKRGAMLRVTAIGQAGQSTLRKYSRSLVNKPIALEVFVQAASSPGIALETAFQRVQRMQRQDLGQFLYDDAWARLTPELRHVLLLMSRVGDSHDQYMMQLCCTRANVTMASAGEAIEESKGIATITRFEGALQIAFNPEFFNYCAERTEMISGVEHPLVDDVEWVRRRYKEFITSASAQVHDRNMKAYRVPSARAAWKFFVEGNKDLSLEHYETAILQDSENGWLFDRYAYTLFTLKRYDEAYLNAKRATILLPKDPEAWFTKGIIESRIRLTTESLASLEKAAHFGKPRHLCELQKAYAYVYSSPQQLNEARALLSTALKLAPKDKFLDRFLAETTRFQRRWFPE